MIGLDRLEFEKFTTFPAAIKTDPAVTVENDGLGRNLRPRVDSDEACRMGM